MVEPQPSTGYVDDTLCTHVTAKPNAARVAVAPTNMSPKHYH